MKNKLWDLTQTIYEGCPDWHGCCGFEMQQTIDYSEGARVQKIITPNGIGTHMDAPSHFILGGKDIDRISCEKFICPGVLLNVNINTQADYQLSVDDIALFERDYGNIKSGTMVVINTQWGQYWHDAAAYRNVNGDGIMRFPTVSVEAANLLLERDIAGIAIDTLSPDLPDTDFLVHHLLLGENKIIIENIYVPDTLPPTGFDVTALPIKIAQATEAPCRVIAIMEEK